jgi:RND family efflux transporter MFP subunit
MRRKPLALSLILVLLAASGAWWWKSHSKPEAGTTAARGAPQSVGVVTALKQDVPVVVEASGTVAALNQVDVRAQTTSTVREVLVKDGQRVSKGQLLFRFDDRADRANLDKARAQLARDRASLADLERQYQRAKELVAQNFIAQSALDTAQASLDAGRGLVQSDEAAVQAAQVALSYNEIRAPFAGRAGAVNVWPGSLVQASATATPLLNIAQIDPIGVSFALPETQLGPVLAALRGAEGGQALEVQVVPARTEGGARRGAKAEPGPKGRLVFVDNLVDASTGTIKLKAEFSNAQQQLWPGQYVRVRLSLAAIQDAVVVPQAAIILRGTERQLYVVGEDKTVQLKTVQLRYAFGELAVVDGIPAGATVVLDGKQNLRPGGAVRTQPAAVNPAAAARRASEAAAAASAASAASTGG